MFLIIYLPLEKEISVLKRHLSAALEFEGSPENEFQKGNKFKSMRSMACMSSKISVCLLGGKRYFIVERKRGLLKSLVTRKHYDKLRFNKIVNLHRRSSIKSLFIKRRIVSQPSNVSKESPLVGVPTQSLSFFTMNWVS